MREHDLRAASTFFDCKNKYNTWRNPRDKCPHQIDHFLIYTVNIKRKLDSMDSDHATKFQVPNGNFILQNSNKKKFQERVSEFFQTLDPQIVASASDDDLLILFENHIIEAAK
jgi:hypothetical protein